MLVYAIPGYLHSYYTIYLIKVVPPPPATMQHRPLVRVICNVMKNYKLKLITLTL